MLIGKAGKLVKRIGSMPCFAAISLVAGSSGCLGSSATTSATDDGGETRMVDVTVPEVGRIPPDGAYAGLDSTTRDSDATVPDLDATPTGLDGATPDPNGAVSDRVATTPQDASPGAPRSLADAASADATASGSPSIQCLTTVDATPGDPPSATCSTTGPVICDQNPVGTLPSAALVTVAAGVGDPPVPRGGLVTPGSYQLVAETVYGTIPPDLLTPRGGDALAEVLSVSCDTYNELYRFEGKAVSVAQGNTCGRLVPYALSLSALAGFPNMGAPSGNGTSYTATAQTLTLISVEPFYDRVIGGILGSYATVDEFALLGTPLPLASVADASAEGGPPMPSGARDPRCPAASPAAGQSCDPRPAPLECEYGGNDYGRCTTFAACLLQTSGCFQFQVEAPSRCGANAAACPVTFSSGVAAEVASNSGLCQSAPLLCDYREGVCGCGSAASASAWTCMDRPDGGAACPTERPLAGDRCVTDGSVCEYGLPCAAGTYLGPAMICENGYWQRLDGLSACPLLRQ